MTQKISSAPQRQTRMRTCIATRQCRPASQLLRIVKDPTSAGHVVIADPQAILPGRGAWISPTIESVELAVQRKAVERALKLAGPVNIDHVREWINIHSAENAPSREENFSGGRCAEKKKEKEDRPLMSTR